MQILLGSHNSALFAPIFWLVRQMERNNWEFGIGNWGSPMPVIICHRNTAIHVTNAIHVTHVVDCATWIGLETWRNASSAPQTERFYATPILLPFIKLLFFKDLMVGIFIVRWKKVKLLAGRLHILMWSHLLDSVSDHLMCSIFLFNKHSYTVEHRVIKFYFCL